MDITAQTGAVAHALAVQLLKVRFGVGDARDDAAAMPANVPHGPELGGPPQTGINHRERPSIGTAVRAADDLAVALQQLLDAGNLQLLDLSAGHEAVVHAGMTLDTILAGDVAMDPTLARAVRVATTVLAMAR